jgi:hypothetical protein
MSERLSTRIEGRWRVTDTHLTTDAGYWCDPYGYCYSYATDWYNSGSCSPASASSWADATDPRDQKTSWSPKKKRVVLS